MSNKVSKEIKLAILGIIAILMFIFGYNYLKGSGIFSSSKIVYAEYDNVSGLTPASYVQLQGFNIGTVKDIELSAQHPGKVRVTLQVDKKLNIPNDSRARIVALDLLGTKAVELVVGKSTINIADEGLLNGELALGTIESLGASAGPAIDNAKFTIASLDTTLHRVNEILDVPTQQHLKSTVNHLQHTMQDFSEFAATLNAQKNKITQLLDELHAFSANLNKNNQTINNVLKNAEHTTDNLSKVNFETTVNELQQTLLSLKSTLDKINQGNGSLALLMNDDKLYKNLKNTLSTANNLIYDINARPSRYINVNLFGKKQKNECPPQVAPNSND